MDYITTGQAAVKWGIDKRRVLEYCRGGRIKDVSRVNKMWIIPRDALKPDDSRLRDKEKIPDEKAHPFLKWAGGKKQLISEISKYYPFSNEITKYAEPFVGGGAVLFDVLNSTDVEEVYINDLNRELINCYRTLRDNAYDVISLLDSLEHMYTESDTDSRREMFNDKRSRFNTLKKGAMNMNKTERASLMIFLNKTCFNGLYRENMKGEFNAPIGAYKSPLICDKNNLLRVSQKLQKVKIHCGKYDELDDFIDDKTFVYFDPPYRPLDITSSFTAYTKEAFNDDSQRSLAKYFRHITEKGAKAVLSNSDPKNVNPDDNFFDDLYNGFKINRISASRNINSRGSGRGKISELLIAN